MSETLAVLVTIPGVSGSVAFRVPGSAGKAGCEPSMLGKSPIFSADAVLGRCRLVRLVKDLAIVP
jgi:hypothetical protein